MTYEQGIKGGVKVLRRDRLFSHRRARRWRNVNDGWWPFVPEPDRRVHQADDVGAPGWAERCLRGHTGTLADLQASFFFSHFVFG